MSKRRLERCEGAEPGAGAAATAAESGEEEETADAVLFEIFCAVSKVDPADTRSGSGHVSVLEHDLVDEIIFPAIR